MNRSNGTYELSAEEIAEVSGGIVCMCIRPLPNPLWRLLFA
jgi:hypothetical protein